MKKHICLLMLALVTALLLCGCAEGPDIQGEWTAVYCESEGAARERLEDLGFFEEEIALMDLQSMEAVSMLRFGQDGFFELGIDAEGYKECFGKFLDAAVEDLYAGRGTLTEFYDEQILEMSIEEFRLFYADVFGKDTYEEFLYELVDLEELAEENTVGTYALTKDRILFTVDGSQEPTKYELKDGKLVVYFADAVIEYTRKG